ncbi:surface layer protein [Lactobacillus acetotolerans]|uniref:Surface layer protein n=1 Tax=Lactobacillus acetotolerans TaxID=1600 RepID=A0A0D6A1F7_9LACO|nr:SLAP domain-containing protein [Lactobacillus acetotolerans]BAQ56581.1 surface layer protein [Lactobacillus acetotolerans]
MKKNLRIVSAAAAALLTVAPVAATAITNPSFGVSSVAKAANDDTASVKLSLLNSNSFKTGAKVSDLSWNTAVNVNGMPGYAHTDGIKVYDLDASVNSGKITKDTSTGKYTIAPDAKTVDEDTTDDGTLHAGHTYIADAKANKIYSDGIKANGGYKINGATTATTATSAGEIDLSEPVEIQSSAMTVHDSNLPGAPFFTDEKGNLVTSGSVDPTKNSVSEVVSYIMKNYESSNTEGKHSNDGFDKASITADVRAGLAAGDVTLNSDGDTYSAASSYLVNVTVTAPNNKQATLPITVHLAGKGSTHDSSYPVIAFIGDQVKTDDNSDRTVPYSSYQDKDVQFNGDYAKKYDYVPLNGTIDKAGIESLFTAQVSGTNGAKITPSFDFSKVDTKVAGAYKVPVTATNPDGKKTTFTLTLHVGAKDAVYKQVTDDAPIYTINGNKVSSTKDTVPKGSNIATFDTVTLGGKSYTRINSEDSNQFVESKYLSDASTEEKKTSKKIMHNAYIYDKDHNRVGKKMLAAYTNVDVYGEATKDSKGNLVYKIGDNQYVMADNITGTVRTLSHNSYVYATSKKRANNKDILAGTKVTTYGSPYTFKNGKSYYRVGGPAKQYIKVVNFAK